MQSHTTSLIGAAMVARSLKSARPYWQRCAHLLQNHCLHQLEKYFAYNSLTPV